jgi:hypothetical protein
LTLPELPGFSLTVKAGSATFPGGSRTGIVSITLVHADKVPMAPGFGQQPRFIVTIQPPGVHFDPPAPMTFPNVDGLAPGAVTEMYSFDHDLGQFVSIGTATVSDNGAMLSSDPGVGIIKGGWHCGGDPKASGDVADCPNCQICEQLHCLDYSGPNLRNLGDPHSRCCTGQSFSTLTQCCTGGAAMHLVGKRPFTGFTDCPNWDTDEQSEFAKGIYDMNGCSIPLLSNPNNPAGGKTTAFSAVDKTAVGKKYHGSDPAELAKYNLPCDAHDRCYQTCHPDKKGTCDDAIYQGIIGVCTRAKQLAIDPQSTIDSCFDWAGKVQTGLRGGGELGWKPDQAAACKCCKD